MEVRRIAKEQEIWDKEEEAVKSEAETRKLVPEKFHKQIYVFSKKTSKQMLIRKLWDHIIDMKKRFMLRKEKVYPLLREEREEVHKFIAKQLRKEYI